MPAGRDKLHPLFRLATLSAAAFVVTVLAMVAAVFADEQTPISQFFSRHGISLLMGEVIVTLVLGILAMWADQRRTARMMEEEAAAGSIGDQISCVSTCVLVPPNQYNDALGKLEDRA